MVHSLWGERGEDGAAWPVYTDHHASHTTELQPNLDDLPPRFVSAITSLLPLDLDVVIASPLVCDEKYWKRRALEERVRPKPPLREYSQPQYSPTAKFPPKLPGLAKLPNLRPWALLEAALL